MPIPEDYDVGVDLPATIKLADGVLKIVGAVANSDRQVVFFKKITEEEWEEELGVDED